MAGGSFQMQNQLKFNLGIPLLESNMAVRYHKPNPIIVERAGGMQNMAQPSAHVSRTIEPVMSARSSVTEDRMALAVRLAQRDFKKQRDDGSNQESGSVHRGSRRRTPSPKQQRTKFSKAGTKIIQTREARERALRLTEKRAGRDPLKIREQGWNSGTTTTARTQTPPRDRQARLPVTTNSPPTRDTDQYPVRGGARTDNPIQEIERLQKEIEGYLQQIQVIEQKAMQDHSADLMQPPKTRRKDGYLDDDEDPARKALRREEQATRAARQIYFLRQQVRALQEHVTRRGADKIKHTKKSQTMTRLAAAHRGAVRAIQGFINQQLPDQDLRRGLPSGYHELALLIRQLALLSTQIKGDTDTTAVHEDLIRMLDRVDSLNRAWCEEDSVGDGDISEGFMEERRRKSPLGRQTVSSSTVTSNNRGRQPQQRPRGKENRPKGLLKKQFNKMGKNEKLSQKTRNITPERQSILRAGLEALVRENPATSRQAGPGMTWNIPADDTLTSEPANTSLILPKPLQHKRERAQKSVVMAVPESHFSDPTLASSLKQVHPDDRQASVQEAWRPGGSTGKSPHRSRSREKSRAYDRSLDRSRSRSAHRQVVIQDMDTELMQELFPQGTDGQGRRGRSVSPRSRSPRQRSRSPPRSPSLRTSRRSAHDIETKLNKMLQRSQNAGMVCDRHSELSEINIRQMLADKAIEKAELSGEVLTEMILNDVLFDTAEELQSLEDDDSVRQEATTMHHNPTLENLYQRLEQMELEQHDIRRRWATLPFEDDSSSNKKRVCERPSGLVAIEITRHAPSQIISGQDTRSYNKGADEPIIFTKSVPLPKFKQKTTPVSPREEEPDEFSFTQRAHLRTRLKISESVVKEIQGNVERYERHLRKTSHQSAGNFDPWKLVEEIADQVLEECLRDIDTELEDIGENIVHQLCKSEFAIPESTPQEQEVAEDIAEDCENFSNFEPTSHIRFKEPLTNQRETANVRESALQRSLDISELRSVEAEAMGHRSRSETEKMGDRSDTERKRERSLKKEVSFHEDISYEREAIFDATELGVADLDTARDSYEAEEDEYDDEEEDDEEDDDEDDDDVEEVSPIDSDNLEYSTDET